MPNLDRLRAEFVDDVARWLKSDTLRHGKSATALLAALEESKGTDPPNPAERTAEAILERVIGYPGDNHAVDVFTRGDLRAAVRLVRALRAERDDLAKRIENAISFYSGDGDRNSAVFLSGAGRRLLRILSGEEK